MQNEALVIKAAGSLYSVKDAATGAVHECRIRGRLRLNASRTTNPVTVGDVVHYELAPEPVIVRLEPRRNYIIRKSVNLSKEAHIVAANLNRALLLATVDFPKTGTEFIDRFLVSAEAYRIPVTLVINKMDLYNAAQKAQVEEWVKMYGDIGYQVICAAVETGQGVDEIRALLEGKITLLSGNSGVGKSKLAAALNPELSVRVGSISDYHNKGKHTTTFSEMFEVAPHSYIIDTPGIKGFGLVDIAREEISHFFPEIFAAARDCKYAGCSHVHEPQCAVRQAVERGTINIARYTSYLKMIAGDDAERYRR